DIWIDSETGISVDLMCRDAGWIEGKLASVLKHCEPQLGYTTALVYTVVHSIPHEDPIGWFAELRALALSPYPNELRRRIIEHNLPLLTTSPFSFNKQLSAAVQRHDSP